MKGLQPLQTIDELVFFFFIASHRHHNVRPETANAGVHLNCLALHVVDQISNLLTRIISRLGVIEFPHSHTDEKIAKYSRVVFGSVLNCIFLPLLSMAIVEGELLGKRGLAGQMLNFSITNCVLPLTLMLFDPIHFTKRLILRVKWLRNKSNWTFIQ